MYDEALLKAIIENAIDGIIVINSHGVILLANPSVSTMFGYGAADLPGQNVGILIPQPGCDFHDGYINKFEATGQRKIIGIGREIIALKKNGEKFSAWLAVSEVADNGERVYTGIIRDLTAEKIAGEKLKNHSLKLEKEVSERTRSLEITVRALEQAKDEAGRSLLREREINQMKTRFVSMASHEFRTPLSSIQLSASLIEHYYNRIDESKIILHLGKIKSGVANLTAILNDFLSVERIESGRVIPSIERFDIRSLCDDLVDGIKIQAKPGQQIMYKHEGPIEIALDSAMIQHCVINLLSNSVKYSGGNGLIKLATMVNKNRFTVRIADNGIGIPGDEQQHLFEAFFRAGNTREFGGTGLGLNIVKRYTELMNGTISFKSTENKGTLFVLRFPLPIN
jgi:two-component system, LuxR family, sensor kinase FixL